MKSQAQRGKPEVEHWHLPAIPGIGVYIHSTSLWEARKDKLALNYSAKFQKRSVFGSGKIRQAPQIDCFSLNLQALQQQAWGREVCIVLILMAVDKISVENCEMLLVVSGLQPVLEEFAFYFRQVSLESCQFL